MRSRAVRFLAIAFLAFLTGSIGRTAPADTAPLGLAEFFKPGVVFQDRNDDGVVDFVDARIALAPAPSAAESAAAADVAARLGYETTAMSLPLDIADARAGRRPSVGATVFIGARALAHANVAADSVGASALKAGEGAVAAFTVGGQPAVAVLGGDDEGLSAAAVMLAGHLPHVWSQKAPTIDTIASEVRAFLSGKGVTPVSATASAVLRPSRRRGCRARGDRAADGRRRRAGEGSGRAESIQGDHVSRFTARAQLREPSATCRSGCALPDRLRPSVDIRHVAAPESAAASAPPPGRRPGGGAKDNFDLSTFYANDGALADTDNNLIPDRVDVLLSPDGVGTAGGRRSRSTAGTRVHRRVAADRETGRRDRVAGHRADPGPDWRIASVGRRS